MAGFDNTGVGVGAYRAEVEQVKQGWGAGGEEDYAILFPSV